MCRGVVMGAAAMLLSVAAEAAWTPTASMLDARAHHTATLLPNGKVLVAGGIDGSGIARNGTELYNPATSTWSAAAPMANARHEHTATLLQNGKVLVVGGRAYQNFGQTVYVAAAEIYDPNSNTWSSAGSLTVSRFGHTATMLSNGNVLVDGGATGAASASFTYLASAQIYFPATNSVGVRLPAWRQPRCRMSRSCCGPAESWLQAEP
ncbi:MAG: hypothetical protein IPM02_21100 [Betaproteobacteria bacterium]|nr:hypothetical protein [Betaproteobacteria bacterium]